MDIRIKMHLYKLIWHEEIVSETNNVEYNEISLPMTQHLRRTDGKYKVDCVTFGPIPNFEIFDRATLTAVNEHTITMLSNSFDVYDDGRIELLQPFKSYKLSLERCKLVDNMLKCEVYFN